jgi:hypothetical protein
MSCNPGCSIEVVGDVEGVVVKDQREGLLKRLD